MLTFLGDLAAKLYGRYGAGISSLRILFPSRRARVFFSNELAAIAATPIWQPEYLSVDELMEEISGLKVSDNVSLITELYKVYSQYHTESFDSFYSWGEVLLSDFDIVDKYLVDASRLFVNISDLKEMESDLSYLTPSQREVVKRFWGNFNPREEGSEEKRNFVRVWNTLPLIYNDYRKRLLDSGMAYQGMVYREAARVARQEGLPGSVAGDGFIVAGFNALCESEKVVFDRLEGSGAAQFYWDYDRYYAENSEQEAGLFIRENILRYPPAAIVGGIDNFTAKEEAITVVSAPSDAMQCKYAGKFLEDIFLSKGYVGKETAIVLTDENLLLPLLHSIPPCVGEVNVTMGYPLRQTPVYAFTERLVELQQRKRTNGSGTAFYHSDVTGLLNSPFVCNRAGAAAETISREITERGQIYVKRSLLEDGGVLSSIFRPVEGWEDMCEYILSVISGAIGEGNGGDGMQAEFLSIIADNVHKLRNSIKKSGVELSVRSMLSLLRKSLLNIRVPYEGEPLAGVQVLGVLETRNLDFENIVILSANDDTFPGNLSASTSFIPYNLRFAYGLPTPQHHEGVYGYYFYRMIQRAGEVSIVYSSKSDDKKTGEPSRYVYQLDYESPRKIEFRNISLNVSSPVSAGYTVEKTPEVISILSKFTSKPPLKKLSPSTFYKYVECPMKFYLHAVASVGEEEEITEEVDLPMFGNIFHSAAEIIYAGLKGVSEPDRVLAGIIGTDAVDMAVRRGVEKEYFRDAGGVSDDEFGGNITLVSEVVSKYLNRSLLDYDSKHGGYTVYDVESWNEASFGFTVQGEAMEVCFAGKTDRIDRLDDGTLRIVDYKTGLPRSEFRGMDSLFSTNGRDRNPAVLQVFVYCAIIERSLGGAVRPELYFIRAMNSEGFSPLLVEVSGSDDSRRRLERRNVDSFADYREAFIDRMGKVLAEIFDPSIPFSRCDDREVCKNCAFREICG